MATGKTPHFQNSEGHDRIEIGVKKFMCVGANAPYDHPHVFLDMGDGDEKVCPYCSTLFVYNRILGVQETQPQGCSYDISQSAA